MGGIEIVGTEHGKFISFEGGEGAGKSTQILRLATYLEARGITVIKTREPGGSPGAEEIRQVLVEGPVDKWDTMAETMLLSAARRSHFAELLEPALREGNWIICDRFSDSTLAYQGYGQGIDFATIRELQMLAIGRFTPNLTFLLDIPVDEGLTRAELRGDAARYERMGVEFHNRVRNGFLKLADAGSDRFVTIDAQLSEQEIAVQIRNCVNRRFGLN